MAVLRMGVVHGMWRTIGYLSLLCAVFIAMLIGLAIGGLKA
jgi:hypothetical protein